MKSSSILKNLSLTLSSNIFSLLISTLVILVIPKVIGIEEYGYLQLYIFYTSYVGFLHFGWNDGIYLRYGGELYGDLNKRLFNSQFYLLVIVQFVIATVVYMVAGHLHFGNDKLFVINMTVISLIFTNLRYMFLFILQGTNRIKDYSMVTILDKLIYIVVIIMFLLIGKKNYQFLIFADLIGRALSLYYSMYLCKDIVSKTPLIKKNDFKETLMNINVGIKLMFSNIASMLIIGIVRLGIERRWSIETFGKISLTLSISNLMLIFINAIGIIMFPLLRRIEESKLSEIYTILRSLLMIVLFSGLLLFYPLRSLLLVWLGNYKESIMYMTLIFPICIYEGKMSLLINTYLKTLRKEKSMLFFNVITLLMSVVMSFITIKILNNLTLTVLLILGLLMFRAIITELYLAKILKITVCKSIVSEVAMTVSFVFSGWFFSGTISFLLFFISYLIYWLVFKNDVKNSLLILKGYFYQAK
ncbi:oligosaccharide flippase family protein [Carnobacterium divergens]|uniref:oligosaccharide flippase family protein n=1 Tax=Carnobacterium divergens TaxID=2748 RepID=UPI001072CEC3|nr:oligosaccharide flippase family protein [Carnobacterium divergens]TFI75727.1 hypothetical protein CKN81_02560 [Carnobacterium divergens]